VEFNVNQCAKDPDNEGDTISHACFEGINGDSNQCVNPSVDGFDFKDDKQESGVAFQRWCQTVAAGLDVYLIVKDGNGATPCGNYIDDDEGATCGALQDSALYPSIVLTSDSECSGNDAGECLWVISTTNECDPDDPRPPGTGGDPHFRTWANEKYSYHGACDMVLLHSDQFDDGKGMDIHIRTKHIREFSYIETAVVRIGDEVFEVTGKDAVYHLNGIKNAELPATLSGHKVTHKKVNEYQNTFLIHLEKSHVVIKTWKNFVSVAVEHGKYHDFGDSLGLMGAYGSGRRVGRDGRTVIEDIAQFADEWQVRADEPHLFQTLSGPQHPQRCAMPPKLTKETARRRLGESIPEEVARKACEGVEHEDFDFCVFDVIATNDITVAGAY
jgi:hypothetical protein